MITLNFSMQIQKISSFFAQNHFLERENLTLFSICIDLILLQTFVDQKNSTKTHFLFFGCGFRTVVEGSTWKFQVLEKYFKSKSKSDDVKFDYFFFFT